MPELEDMTPGQVLADANVADFIGSMGLAIAKAQTALDENSVSQIADFAAPREGLNGRSLFDLGLSPAFYHYQHADLAVSLQLQLRVEKTFGLDIGANFNFSDTDTSNNTENSSESSTESGSSTRTSHREAEISVSVTTNGALVVNGNNFQLSGGTPLARIENLADQLRGGSDVDRALVLPAVTAVNPTCAPPSDDVVTSPNAVTFLNQGMASEAVIRITRLPAGANEDFTLKNGKVATVAKQSDTTAQGDATATSINALGYQAVAWGAGTTLETCHFDFDKALIDQTSPAEPRTNRQKLSRVARILIATGLKVEIEGYTDRSGPAPYNVRLGGRRSAAVKSELQSMGVPAGQLREKLPSTGESSWASEPPPQRNQAHRITRIRLIDTTDRFVFVQGDSSNGINTTQVRPDTRSSITGPDNGFVYVGTSSSGNNDLTSGGRKIVIKGTDFPLNGSVNGSNAEHSPEAYAANLARDVNANSSVGVRAWATGNVCNLANNGDRFQLILVTSQSRAITMSGTDDITVTTQFSRTSSNSVERTDTGNQTVAVGATVGLRFGRQYETNITGNSSISARLVAVPGPVEFLDQIKEFLAE